MFECHLWRVHMHMSYSCLTNLRFLVSVTPLLNRLAMLSPGAFYGQLDSNPDWESKTSQSSWIWVQEKKGSGFLSLDFSVVRISAVFYFWRVAVVMWLIAIGFRWIRIRGAWIRIWDTWIRTLRVEQTWAKAGFGITQPVFCGQGFGSLDFV